MSQFLKKDKQSKLANSLVFQSPDLTTKVSLNDTVATQLIMGFVSKNNPMTCENWPRWQEREVT